MTTKLEILSSITFGKQVAEDELDDLRRYFVETTLWHRMLAGEIDLVYGAKGSGKSAIYSLLLDKKEELAGRRTFLVPAENVRAAPVFTDLRTDPPTEELEFQALWKLYFLSLVGTAVRELNLRDSAAVEFLATLTRADLLPARGADLYAVFRKVRDYTRSMFHPESIAADIKVDPNTGMATGFGGKITFHEPSAEERARGHVTADDLFRKADVALQRAKASIWVLLDRLDVAFAESPDLERNALRALFRVYLDLRVLGSISLKVFLRSDIWERVADAGFREGSHLTKQATIEWDDRSLMNLVIRRALTNPAIVAHYDASLQEILGEFLRQKALFYRMFPEQVERGPRKSRTFDWMLSHTRDGSGMNAPRELIHLLDETRQEQVAQLEIGDREPAGEKLFGPSAIKAALTRVSLFRLRQTIYMEYPTCKPLIEKFERQKTRHTVSSLQTIWGVDESCASESARKLTDIGFFRKDDAKDPPEYDVPFLYRGALRMKQGAAGRQRRRRTVGSDAADLHSLPRAGDTAG